MAQGKTAAKEQEQTKKLRDAQVKMYELQLEQAEREAKKDQERQAVLSKFQAPQPLNPQSGMIAAPLLGAGQAAPKGGNLMEMLTNASLGDLEALGVNPLELAKLQQPKEQKAQRPFAVSPGQTVIDPTTGKPLFSLPALPEKGAAVDPWKGINIPTGFAPKDPTNPNAGIMPLPGFTPAGEAEKGKPFEEVEAAGNYTIRLLDELVNHPGMKDVVGAPNPFTAWTPGTDAAGFKTRLRQIQGTQFLQAFETLKGGGQITQVEGEKAQAAIARMDASQSEEDFKEAATEFQGIIKSGLERARKRAGVAPKVGGDKGMSGAQDIRRRYQAGEITAEEARKLIKELNG
jgi:hypothetical protein